MAASDTSEGGLVLLEKRDGLGIITLNRPAKRNAMNGAAQAALQQALADTREDCRVLILTGAGSAFCAGIDLAESRTTTDDRWLETNEILKAHPGICIAAVNGYALGGGLTLVHNCELAIASERAEFGMPEMSFGSFPVLAGPATIRRVLPKHAAYLILTARRIDAATAERWGIVNSVVAPERLLAEAEALAARILQFDAAALDSAKQALRDLELMPWSAALEHGGAVAAQVRARSHNERDALAAFGRGERVSGQGTDVP